MKTQRVVFTGAVLSRLYATCAEADAPFDGLLFGTRRPATPHDESVFIGCHSSHAKDVYDDAQGVAFKGLRGERLERLEGVRREEAVLMVTHVLTSAAVCSFYDGAGKVNREELTQLATQCRDPFVGWCSFTTENLTDPSLLHKRVSHALTRLERPASLFCLLSLYKEHHEATVTLEYKAYLSCDASAYPALPTDVSSGRVLISIPVEILNIGDQRGEGRYAAMWPSSFNFLSQSLDESDAMRRVSEIEAIGLEPQKRMINALQKQCGALLQEYERNVAHVRSGVQEIHKRKADLARLKSLCGST